MYAGNLAPPITECRSPESAGELKLSIPGIGTEAQRNTGESPACRDSIAQYETRMF